MKISLTNQPVGIKFFQNIPNISLPSPKVKSFCEGISKLLQGEYPDGVLFTEQSIDVCIWSPVSLGFREAKNKIDGSVPNRFKNKTKAIAAFTLPFEVNDHPLLEFIKEPDVVIIFTSRTQMDNLVGMVGLNNLGLDHANELLYSANREFITNSKDQRTLHDRKRRIKKIRGFNRFFGSRLIRNNVMIRIITALMRKSWMARFMNYISAQHTSGCSLCYSSASLPFHTGKANVTFTDSGSVIWGGFKPTDMVMGLPYSLYKKVADSLVFADNNIEPSAQSL